MGISVTGEQRLEAGEVGLGEVAAEPPAAVGASPQMNS